MKLEQIKNWVPTQKLEFIVWSGYGAAIAFILYFFADLALYFFGIRLDDTFYYAAFFVLMSSIIILVLVNLYKSFYFFKNTEEETE